MYQKRILPYFVIPSTFSPQASSPLSHHGQTDFNSHPLIPYLFLFWENRNNTGIKVLASRLLGGRFFRQKSHADIQTGRISGMFSQAEFPPLFELSSYLIIGETSF